MGAIDAYRKARDLKELDWREYHPNNMVQNPLEGYYAIVNGDGCARKYTILFQWREDKDHPGCITRQGGPEMYILFEKAYNHRIKNYPKPVEGNINFNGMRDINDYGEFVRAYINIEDAKRDAIIQYKAVFMYAMSYILTDKEREILIKEEENIKKDEENSLNAEKTLMANLDKLHTTKAGEERIKKNCQLKRENVIQWVKDKVTLDGVKINQIGKNWYVQVNGYEITINANSYTVITAHKI